MLLHVNVACASKWLSCAVSLHAGARVKTAKQGVHAGRRGRSKVDEARDIMANVVLCHIPVLHYDFQQKARACVASSGLPLSS